MVRNFFITSSDQLSEEDNDAAALAKTVELSEQFPDAHISLCKYDSEQRAGDTYDNEPDDDDSGPDDDADPFAGLDFDVKH
jgi:hypothetical protein